MNPHTQTPLRSVPSAAAPGPSAGRNGYLLLPQDSTQSRHIQRLRVIVTVLFIAFISASYLVHYRHVRDINAAAKACHDGWKVCRQYTKLPVDFDASEDFGVCGVGYQTCIEEVHDAAYLF